MDATGSLTEDYKNLLLDDVFRTHDRRRKVYNHQEREKIEEFRQQYMEAGSNRGRKEVVCCILPVLFNYWVETGSRAVSQTEDFTQQEAKKLLKWIRNNWRSAKPTEAELTGHPKKRTTILWRTRKEDVYKEIAAILGVDSVTAGTPGIFENRMKAMGNILARMSDAELKQLDLDGKALETVEYTDEQKRANADKHAFRKLDEASKRDWAEMGLMNITFVTRLTESGQLAVRVHDQIANILGVSSTSFEDQKSAEVKQMKRFIGVYVRGLLNARDRAKDGGGDGDGSISMLDQDEHGFPKLPRDFEPDKLNKRQLETLMGLYFSQHYSLATNGRSKHPPYDYIEKKQSAFISPNYLPRGLKLAPPRNMNMEDIRLLLTHLRQRQETFPLSQVFRFHKVKKHRKGEEMISSQYPDEEIRLEEPKRPIPAAKKSHRRKKVSKSKLPKPTRVEIQPTRIEEMPGASNLLSFDREPSTQASIDYVPIDPQLLGHGVHTEIINSNPTIPDIPPILAGLQDQNHTQNSIAPQEMSETSQFSLETVPAPNIDISNPALSHLQTFIYPPPESAAINYTSSAIPLTNLPTTQPTTPQPANLPTEPNNVPKPRPKPRPRRKPVTAEEIAQAEENQRLLEEARSIEKDLLANGSATVRSPSRTGDPPVESEQPKGNRRKRSEVEESLIISGKRIRRVRERTS
ncbi:hypothetical protein JR316_0008733 [Psilocybe cubensis]|uniref:Uncharacterized protein n=2 Tax=Psilocybe cubensis TaxID=181762 RepID=A0A8H8CIP9_PSICU|nr:hypothetical protein JR316_0008733 [Psilocybe cubensis]KAH9478280.1 hypothetical protein JR316_0008733 [Psilocybe cubensis]